MKVISAPPRLRLATACLFLAIPLLVVHGMLAFNLPWWRLPLRGTLVSVGALAFICALLVWKILSARTWALILLIALGILWFGIGAEQAVAFRRPALGFFSLGLVLYLAPLIFLIGQELRKSFIDPQLRWYQGAPRAIPQLNCQVQAPDGNRVAFRVCRLDHEGAFMYSGEGAAPAPRWSARIDTEMSFSFRDRSVSARGRATASCLDGQAIGIRFEGMSPDSGKDLGEFIEKLKGEGYV